MRRRVLITGAAGFIGSQLMARLKSKGVDCVGLDNFNNHLYCPKLKRDRVDHFNLDIVDCDLKFYREVETAVLNYRPTDIIHLAAHAGVRDSFGREKAYHSNNIDATQNLIDCCRTNLPDVRIVYASTSCVYADSPLPWTEGKEYSRPKNAYGWSKLTNEFQFQGSQLTNVGLRFFTVYGPWGRPDMALYDFTEKVLDGQYINVYNYGNMNRDFTYIDDILDGIELVLEKLYMRDIESGEIYNIGRGQRVPLLEFITEIEKNVGNKAKLKLVAKHPADTVDTWSNVEKLGKLGYKPKVNVQEGIKNFYKWFKQYNGV